MVMQLLEASLGILVMVCILVSVASSVISFAIVEIIKAVRYVRAAIDGKQDEAE